MDRLVLFLLILSLMSCDKMSVIKRDGITFHFTDNVGKSRQPRISQLITSSLKNVDLKILKSVKDIKVDSVPFSILLYIPIEDSLGSLDEEAFKSWGNLLTNFEFKDTPVHIILADANFRGKSKIAYDRDAVQYTGRFMRRGRVEIAMTESASIFSPDLFEDVLRNRIPELYKGQDSIKFAIDLIRDTVKIDLNIDRDIISVDSVKSEFRRADALLFYLLFSNRTILFHLRDKKTKSVVSVYGIRGT